jgi:hypothetical protein
MKDLMTAFRFKVDSVDSFKAEFSSLLAQHANKGELLGDQPVFRFDLARQIFLERGL